MVKKGSDVESLKRSIRRQYQKPMADELIAKIDAKLPKGHAASIATFGAGDRLYRRLPIGRFEGQLSVIWNGQDEFIHEPNPVDPFRYTTSQGVVIIPGRMNTDGGSIPRILRGFKKFSSWGYAPSYLIHDWLFTAHKCQIPPNHLWTFQQSASLLGECIKTLMEIGYRNFDGNVVRLPKAEDTLWAIYTAVGSSIARGLWDNQASVVCRPQPGAAL